MYVPDGLRQFDVDANLYEINGKLFYKTPFPLWTEGQDISTFNNPRKDIYYFEDHIIFTGCVENTTATVNIGEE